MARRTNEELWKDRQAPNRKGEGTIFEVIRNGQKTFRAVRVTTLRAGEKPMQISGTGRTPDEAVERREQNVVKRLASMGGASQAAAYMKKANITPVANDISLDSPFCDLLFDWLKWKKRQTLPSKRITPAVYKQYETHVRLHLAPSKLGMTQIGALNRNVFDEYFFETLIENTKPIVRNDKVIYVPYLSVSNRRAQQAIVNQALNYAVSTLRILDINPASGMERIPKDDYRISDENLEKKRKLAYKLAMLLDGHPQEARWMVSLLLGLRQSEALGLDWQESFMYLDDNIEGRPARVIVKQQLVRDPDTGELSIEERTKSKTSTRVIPLDPRLVEILRAHRKRQQELKKLPGWNAPKWARNLVFTEKDGRPTSHQRDHKRWRALLKSFSEELGGDEVRLHAVRHFAASIMITSGATAEEAKLMLGHSSTVVTKAVYLHMGAQNLVEPTEALTSAVFRDRDKARRGEPVAPYDDDEYYERNN
jgi:integrase